MCHIFDDIKILTETYTTKVVLYYFHIQTMYMSMQYNMIQLDICSFFNLIFFQNY